MEFKIDKGITAPRTNASKYPFENMEVGDSFFAPGRTPQAIGSAYSQYKRSHKQATMKFVTRSCAEDGVEGTRCWRVR